MTWLKSVFSVWIGVFLILPNCICQVVAPFGIILHPQEYFRPDPSAVPQPAAVLPVELSFERPVPCCCGDEDDKTAEEYPSADPSEDTGPGPAGMAALLCVRTPSPAATLDLTVIRPPPVLAAQATVPAFSGNFRL